MEYITAADTTVQLLQGTTSNTQQSTLLISATFGSMTVIVFSSLSNLFLIHTYNHTQNSPSHIQYLSKKISIMSLNCSTFFLSLCFYHSNLYIHALRSFLRSNRAFIGGNSYTSKDSSDNKIGVNKKHFGLE